MNILETREISYHGSILTDFKWGSVDKNGDVTTRWITELETDHLVNIIRTQTQSVALFGYIAGVLKARGVTRQTFMDRVNEMHRSWVEISPRGRKLWEDNGRSNDRLTSWYNVDYVVGLL